MFTNFYEETMRDIKNSQHTVNDIAFIGTYRFKLNIQQFFKIAKNTDYDNGYGSAEIPTDILIVFKDGSFFRRHEYDGSECWRFHPYIHTPSNFRKLKVKSFTDFRHEDFLETYCE